MKNLTIILIFILSISLRAESHEVLNRDYSDCGLNQQSIKLAQLIIESENQQRKVLYCDKTLSQAAFDKAKLMAKADSVSHNIEHTTPNQFLRSYGVKLPNEYPLFDNQVEAIMGAVSTAEDSFKVFMTSPDHKSHLLGETDFVVEQDQIGVGFFKDSDTTHVYYWVIYITSIDSDD